MANAFDLRRRRAARKRAAVAARPSHRMFDSFSSLPLRDKVAIFVILATVLVGDALRLCNIRAPSRTAGETRAVRSTPDCRWTQGWRTRCSGLAFAHASHYRRRKMC